MSQCHNDQSFCHLLHLHHLDHHQHRWRDWQNKSFTLSLFFLPIPRQTTQVQKIEEEIEPTTESWKRIMNWSSWTSHQYFHVSCILSTIWNCNHDSKIIHIFQSCIVSFVLIIKLKGFESTYSPHLIHTNIDSETAEDCFSKGSTTNFTVSHFSQGDTSVWRPPF